MFRFCEYQDTSAFSTISLFIDSRILAPLQSGCFYAGRHMPQFSPCSMIGPFSRLQLDVCVEYAASFIIL